MYNDAAYGLMNDRMSGYDTTMIKEVLIGLNKMDITEQSDFVFTCALNALEARIPESEFLEFLNKLEA